MPGATAAKTGDIRARTGDVPGRRTGDIVPGRRAGEDSIPAIKTTGDLPPMRARAPSAGSLAGNSKPPPPLPSSIAQRGKQPSLSELAADTKDKDKK
jgi:hypothetical protein